MSFITAPWASPQAVSSVLVTAPTEEPLTLDEAKMRAGFDWAPGDPREPLMLSFVAAARAQVEQDTGLALLTQTRDVLIQGSIGMLAIPWQAWPVQSIVDLAAGPVAPARYATWSDWSNLWVRGGSWRVVAGWPNPAALRAEAPLLLHAVGLLTAHYATLGRDLALSDHTIERVPLGYDEAIAPYRMLVLP